MGCYKDDTDRALQQHLETAAMTVELCVGLCLSLGKTVSGVRKGINVGSVVFLRVVHELYRPLAPQLARMLFQRKRRCILSVPAVCAIHRTSRIITYSFLNRRSSYTVKNLQKIVSRSDCNGIVTSNYSIDKVF